MTFEERIEALVQDRAAASEARALRSDQPVLRELVEVLSAHPGGLRRWSVMRAIRKLRDSAMRDIPQKFEDEVERTFRHYCADTDNSKVRGCAPEDALFYRPKEKAGEVWAIITDAQRNAKS
jgi:hypothetical protein